MRSPTSSQRRTRTLERAVESGFGVLEADVQRPNIGFDQLGLALELVGDQAFDHADFNIQQRRERADIDDVLEQLTLPQIGIFAGADFRQRHAERDDVAAQTRGGPGSRRIIEEVTSRLDRRDVLVEGLGVHGDHDVGPAERAEPASFADANLIPGRQPLDIRGKDVAGGDRDAHAQDRTREQQVGAGGAGTIDVCETYYKIVYCLDRHA